MSVVRDRPQKRGGDCGGFWTEQWYIRKKDMRVYRQISRCHPNFFRGLPEMAKWNVERLEKEAREWVEKEAQGILGILDGPTHLISQVLEVLQGVDEDVYEAHRVLHIRSRQVPSAPTSEF